MSRDKHPSDMTKAELELEVAASRIVLSAISDCIETDNLQYTDTGISKMRIAGDKARALYLLPVAVRH
ncbi:MAG: hypothetical protein ACRCXB_23035 [Aeromonadaceae bacterium]